MCGWFRRSFRSLVALPLTLTVPAVAQATDSGTGDASVMPPGLMAAVRAALPDDYAVVAEAGSASWSAHNVSQHLRVTFEQDAIEVRVLGDAASPPLVTLGLAAWGREGDLTVTDPARVVADGARVEYHRGPLVEWYLNGPQGIEQGFTVETAPPRGAASAPLELRLTVGGSLTPYLNPGRHDLVLQDEAGVPRLLYGHLAAWDANGARRTAWLELSEGALSMLVDDDGATYPLIVDPLIATEEARLAPHDASPNDYFGSAVAVSGDTAIVGAPQDDHSDSVNAGAAYVFVRSGSTWTQQAKLTVSTENGLGQSVGLSGDTAVVGAPGGDGVVADTGAAYVFVRSGTVWTLQTKLTASDGAASDGFGSSVTIAGDTVIVGAPDDDTASGIDAGSAYVFVRSGTVWSPQGPRLPVLDGAAGDNFGTAVSLYVDTAVVGAPHDDTALGADAGSMYVYKRSGTVWNQVGPKLGAGDGTASDAFGSSVAVSNGRAIAGAPNDVHPVGTNIGSAYVFLRSGTVWIQEGPTLIASDPFSIQSVGRSVALSGDTAVLGAANPAHGYGAYVFERNGSSWNQQDKLFGAETLFDQFGFSVAMVDDTLVVGSPGSFYGAVDYAGASFVYVNDGATWNLEAELTASVGTPDNQFGISVGLSGDTAIVGAPRDMYQGILGRGAAYVFVRSGAVWTQQARLLATDGAEEDNFGLAVALSGDRAVVGARLEESGLLDNSGAAYVFERSGTSWSQVKKLTASDAASGDMFGWDVAIEGSTVVVGSRFDDSAGGLNAGSAYVYVLSGFSWIERKLEPLDPQVGGLFGNAVAVSGDRVIVGDSGASPAPGGTGSGASYVFVRSGLNWSQEDKLAASDAAPSDSFGDAVAIDGDTAVVGAARDDHDGFNNAGAVYAFERSGSDWIEKDKLTASDMGQLELFGFAVALSGDTLVAGARDDDHTGLFSAGAVYAFGRTGSDWNEQAMVTATDAASGDTFGADVALSVDTVIAGAPGDDHAGGADAGSAYVLRLQGNEDPWTDLGFGLAGGSGTPRFVGTGSLAPASSGRLDLAGANPSSPAFLFVSLTGLPAAFKGGTLVPVPVDKTVGLVTDGTGAASLSWTSWPSGLAPGTELYFQFAVKDPGAPVGAALSNALLATTP